MTYPEIETALNYLRGRGVKIPAELLKRLAGDLHVPLTSADKASIAHLNKTATKQAGTYQGARQSLWAAVYDAVYDFLSSNAQVGTYSRPLATALSQAYIETLDVAYEDGGGTLPVDDDTNAWARAELDAQLDYVDSMFQTLKAMRKEGDFDAINEAFRRADGYANSLDSFYNNVKVGAAGNKMLTFAGDDGAESCDDCQKYKNQRHRASWWISHDAVPPNRNFECRGYNCHHVLVDDNGNEWTV